MSRTTLGKARRADKDEFYTRYDDVKFELDHYLDQLKGKVVYCPCDTENSNFVKYFKELERSGIIEQVVNSSINDFPFDSEFAKTLYDECDVIVTNPPFSLFREFMSLVESTGKEFIIWGNNNALSYHVIARMLRHNKVHLGYIRNCTCKFEVPEEYKFSSLSHVCPKNDKWYCKVPACSVFTNMNVYSNTLELKCKYDTEHYPKYDNYDAINVNKVKEIPCDYYEPIGVPITYMSQHDSSKFKILGVFNNFDNDPENGRLSGNTVKLDKAPWKTRGPCLHGHALYARLIIQRL